jgi:hypothetical protein
VEKAFQASKGLCGRDQHQVRRWRSWYRWVTLAMLAYAFLVVAAGTEHARHPPPLGLIPLTRNEIQHLFAGWPASLPAIVGTGCAARGGDAGTRPAPGPATTAGKPTAHEDHELRLEYYPGDHRPARRRPRRQSTGRRSVTVTGYLLGFLAAPVFIAAAVARRR